MTKLDIAMVYRDRVEEIKKCIKKAVKQQNWTKKQQFEKEKRHLEEKINEIESRNNN